MVKDFKLVDQLRSICGVHPTVTFLLEMENAASHLPCEDSPVVLLFLVVVWTDLFFIVCLFAFIFFLDPRRSGNLLNRLELGDIGYNQNKKHIILVILSDITKSIKENLDIRIGNLDVKKPSFNLQSNEKKGTIITCPKLTKIIHIYIPFSERQP